MNETPESIAAFLVLVAADIRKGKPIEDALDELQDAMDEWRKQFRG